MRAKMATIKKYRNEQWDGLVSRYQVLPRKFRISKLIWETGEGDVFTWELESLDDCKFSFQPGQFNMLYAHGLGEIPVSISGDSESGMLTHTTRAVGAVTSGLQKLRVGEVIGVRGPFGSPWPIKKAFGKDLLIIAGGIGLAPLRSIIYYALNHRHKFNRVKLVYGARTPLEIIYRSELEHFIESRDIDVSIIVDKVCGYWSGQVGVVTNLIPQLEFDHKNALALICGPEVMMHFSRLTLNKVGVTDSQIYVSMERNMKCAIGHCGHCQWGRHFICKDGPVFRFDQIQELFKVHEL